MENDTVVYTGEEQDPVIFAAKNAGVVEAKHFFPKGSDQALQSLPTAPGVYTVKVDTAESDIYRASKALEIGTFTINKAEPEKELYTLGADDVRYTGKKQEPTITPAKEAGAVKAVHYYAKGEKAPMPTAPTAPGVYTVKIDTAESDDYTSAEAFDIGTFTIRKARPTKDLYTMGTTDARYTGAEQNPTIIPAKDAGAVKAVRYYAVNTGQRVNGSPIEAGVYAVRIDTAANGFYETDKSLEIGTLTIK